MLDVFRALDLKVFDPLGSTEGGVQHRGAFVAFGNTAPAASKTRPAAAGRAV